MKKINYVLMSVFCGIFIFIGAILCALAKAEHFVYTSHYYSYYSRESTVQTYTETNTIILVFSVILLTINTVIPGFVIFYNIIKNTRKTHEDNIEKEYEEDCALETNLVENEDDDNWLNF